MGPLGLCALREIDHVRGRLFEDALGPQAPRGCSVGIIPAAIVERPERRARLAGLVVQTALDDMRRGAAIPEPGCHRPAQVVPAPGLELWALLADESVDLGLQPREVLEGTAHSRLEHVARLTLRLVRNLVSREGIFRQARGRGSCLP